MSVERLQNGALKLTDPDGTALYAATMPDCPKMRISARGNWPGAQLVLVDLDEHDVEDLRRELGTWLANRRRATS